MFTGGLRESERDTVRLQGVCPTVLAHLLCFMYTGEIVINEMLVCQLLPAATMFQVNTGILTLCLVLFPVPPCFTGHCTLGWFTVSCTTSDVWDE